MRSNRAHLRLVGVVTDSAAPVIEVFGGAHTITVRVRNVRPGQICEVMHRRRFSLSQRTTVPAGDTSVTITSFRLQQGNYEVTIRIDDDLEPLSQLTRRTWQSRADEPKRSRCGRADRAASARHNTRPYSR